MGICNFMFAIFSISNYLEKKFNVLNIFGNHKRQSSNIQEYLFTKKLIKNSSVKSFNTLKPNNQHVFKVLSLFFCYVNAEVFKSLEFDVEAGQVVRVWPFNNVTFFVNPVS